MKKKMKKTFSLWLCVLLFAAGLPLGAQAASFYDVPSNAWYSQAVNSLADQGIVSGTGGGNYSPKATLTRAAFVTMLAKATLSATDLSQYTFSSSFSDVKSSYWGNRYINWAVKPAWPTAMRTTPSGQSRRLPPGDGGDGEKPGGEHGRSSPTSTAQ